MLIGVTSNFRPCSQHIESVRHKSAIMVFQKTGLSFFIQLSGPDYKKSHFGIIREFLAYFELIGDN